MIVFCMWLSCCAIDTINPALQEKSTLPLDSTITWEIMGEKTSFNSLWQTMDSMKHLGSGAISCLYIGGSHVQGGWIGHGIRQRFECVFPNSNTSRGWLLPYRMAQTDTPTHFRTETTGLWSGRYCTKGSHRGPFGSTGLRAHTEDIDATWQHFSIRSDSSLHEATTLEVWGNAKGCIPHWLGQETLLERRELAHGKGWRFDFEQVVDTVLFGIETLGEERVSFDLFATVQRFHPQKRAQFTLYEWGNNGAQISDAMRCEAWEQELPSLNLDLIILGLGLNDVHAAGATWNATLYEEMYSGLVRRIQQILPNAALLLLSNTDSVKKGKSIAKESQHAHSIQQSIASKYGCATFDLGRAMGPPGCIEQWRNQGLAKSDLIHFTSDGYDVLAELIFSAWFQAYTTQRSLSPASSSQHP